MYDVAQPKSEPLVVMSMGKMVLSYEDTVSRMSELLTSASERDHCASRKKSSLTV